jgi:hypothetical protein
MDFAAKCYVVQECDASKAAFGKKVRLQKSVIQWLIE